MAEQWTGRHGELSGLRYIEITGTAIRPDSPLVIGLHGRGSNPDDLAGLAPALDPAWRYFFPQAPQRLDLGGWARSFSWYEPIMSDQERQQAPRVGVPVSASLLAAREQFHAFLTALHEQTGVPPEHSALLGFSQGAAMVLDTGLRARPPYAALVAMSGFLPEAADLASFLPAVPAGSLLLIHGTADPVIPLGIALRAKQVLARGGLLPDYREFPMQHEVNDASLQAVAAFLHQRLGPFTPAAP